MSRNAAHAGRYALGTFQARGRHFAGLVLGDLVHPIEELSGLPHPSVRELLEHWDSVRADLDDLAARVATADSGLELELLQVLAPVEPRQIFQSGANYRTHVMDLAAADRKPGETRSSEEIRAEVGRQQDERAASGQPYVFTGLVSAMCGPYDDVILPAGTKKNDFELELAAVIGRPARRVSPEDALDHVAGYTIVNDLTTREWVWRRDLPELGTDWFRAKNSPTFLPTGPVLVPRAAVPDPGDLRLTLRLNGEVMQDESTRDMLFDVAHVIAHCSTVATLLPGDLVLTGSPAGNGLPRGRLLRAGDRMDSTITGLGSQANRCVPE